MEDSAAATVRTNKVINCPMRSSKKTDAIKKLKFIDKKTSSIDIIIIKTFFLFKKTPQSPEKKRKKGTTKKLVRFI